MLADYFKKDDTFYEYNNYYVSADYDIHDNYVFQSEESSADEDDITF